MNKPQLEESGTMLRCIICTSRQNDDKIMEPFNKKKKTKQGECACVAQQQDAIDFLLLQNGYLAATMVAVFSLAGAAIEVTAPVENIAGRYRVRK